ncbi:MAG: hypothetical protein ABUL71_00810 [Gemmatimonadota bacterium]
MVSQTDPEHPSDESLLALIHQQPFDASATTREHLQGCASCAARSQALSANDAVIARLLESLDDPLPALRPSFAMRHASQLRRAGLIAGTAATMAVAAAAMVPSSPLHRWIVAPPAPASGVRSTAAATSPESAVTPAPAADIPLASGIAIPAQATLIVAFRREQDGGAVEINRTTTGDVAFRSRGGTTAYEVADGRVTIDNQSPAETYLIDIPASVRQVRIRVGSRTLIRWPEDSARYTLTTDPRRARVDIHTAATSPP